MQVLQVDALKLLGAVIEYAIQLIDKYKTFVVPLSS